MFVIIAGFLCKPIVPVHFLFDGRTYKRKFVDLLAMRCALPESGRECDGRTQTPFRVMELNDATTKALKMQLLAAHLRAVCRRLCSLGYDLNQIISRVCNDMIIDDGFGTTF